MVERSQLDSQCVIVRTSFAQVQVGIIEAYRGTHGKVGRDEICDIRCKLHDLELRIKVPIQGVGVPVIHTHPGNPVRPDPEPELVGNGGGNTDGGGYEWVHLTFFGSAADAHFA